MLDFVSSVLLRNEFLSDQCPCWCKDLEAKEDVIRLDLLNRCVYCYSIPDVR